MLISDEPYREIVYGAEVPWVPSIYEHTIVCYSYSSRFRYRASASGGSWFPIRILRQLV